MFDGKAEEAMHYYVSVFDRAEIVSIHRYGANEAGAEGTVVHATFSLGGQVFMCMDSNVKHDFTFTPSISLYVACATEEEIDRLFEKLYQGGTVAMPLATYPFSDKFAGTAPLNGERVQRDFPRTSTWTLGHIGIRQWPRTWTPSSLGLDPRIRPELVA